MKRQFFYQHLQNHCAPAEVIIYLVVQQALNTTITTKERDLPVNELDDLDWFIQLRYGETMLQRIPTVIESTRGSVMIMQSFKVKALSCVTTKSLSRKLDYVFVTVINGSTWLALFLVSLVYALVYKSILRGFDTMWPQISQPCWLHHPRKLICAHWICMVFLSCIYGSSISSESLQLPTFPSIQVLYEKGYRVWMPEKQYLFRFAGKYEKEILVDAFSKMLGNNVISSKNYEKSFKTPSDFIYDGNGSGVVHTIPLKNMSSVIQSLTT
ncbi:unnamed protein product [Orchesella dallaii]|uniref:Uncharacterized protein n=1 Tax=Orchesella dallaii TaxID=48710 RepID=A0ABP1S8S9_9HEXA